MINFIPEYPDLKYVLDYYGTLNESLGIYYEGGAPCLQSQDSMTTFILIGVFGSIFFRLIGTYLYYRAKNKMEIVEYFVY